MGLATGVLVAVAAVLQVPQAFVSGVVRDAATGRALPGATVVVIDTGLGTLSDERGAYTLSGVPAGPQHLRISQLGYASRTVHALVPSAGRLELDLSLRAEPIELQGIDVESRSLRSIVPEARGTGERAITTLAMRSHPLLSEPDAFRALAGGGVVVDPESPYGLHVRGGDTGHTGFALDGIPVLDPVHAAGLFSAWNPAALDRVDLSSPAATPSLPDALSGVVEGKLRPHGQRMGAEASLSTTQAALEAHGPWGSGGYVLSLRSGFPGLVVPTSDPSYLRGESGDAILHVEAPWLGGDVEALYYASDNEITLGRLIDPSSGAVSGGGPSEWEARSAGLTWRLQRPRTTVELKAWRAASTAEATWVETSDVSLLEARRRDFGAQASLRALGARTYRELDVRVEHIATGYESTASASFRPEGGVLVLGVSGEQANDLGAGLQARVGGGLRTSRGRVYAPIQAAIAWSPDERWTWRLSAARTQQFTQSLVNTESVARHALPFELPVAAGVDGVPVSRSDQLALDVEWLPSPGLRVTAEAYARRLRDLLLVAPLESSPFATSMPALGSGSARGISLEAAGSGARFGWLARYDGQRVLRRAEQAFRPAQGAAHILSAGLVVHPGPTWSLRVGADAALGRRGTEVRGPFEWEACNLGDGGCEFAGAPSIGGPLGAAGLPAYLRADVGIRKHWHLSVGARSTTLGVFGSVTNVLGRQNVLAYVRDGGGGLSPAQMLPTGPLVVGLDWRF